MTPFPRRAWEREKPRELDAERPTPVPAHGNETGSETANTIEVAPMSRLQRGLTGLSAPGGASIGAAGSRIGGASLPNLERQGTKSFEELKRLIHGKLVDKLDLSRVSDLEGETLRREIRLVVERLCDTENPL